MQHTVKQIADFRRLPVEALGQQHRELRCINVQTSADHSGIHPLGSRCDQRVTFLHQRPGHQFNEVDGDNWHMTAAQDGNPSFAFVLQQRQFLRQGVNPIEGWKIE